MECGDISWWKIPSVKANIAGLVVLVSIGFIPAFVTAGEPDQEQGLQALRTANDAFDEEDFDIAYNYYVEAYEILEVPMIKYRMGQTAEKTGHIENAVEHYEAYREIGEDEEFRARIDEALPRLREQLPATVDVITDPQGATLVVIDAETDEQLGESPVTFDHEPGEVQLEMRLEGHETERIEKRLEPGQKHTVEVTLEPEVDEQPDEVAEADEPAEKTEEVAEADEPEETIELEPLEQLEEPDDGPGLGMLGWTSTGLGASMLALGGVMTYFQMDATEQVNQFDRAGHREQLDPAEWESLRQQQQALRDDANSYYHAAVGAYVAGGVLTAAGLGLLTFDFLDGDDADADLSVGGGVNSSGGMVTIDGRF